MKDLLSPSEVGYILRVDSTTVRRWVVQGVLQAEISQFCKSGRYSYKIKRETVEKLLVETSNASKGG